MARSRLVPATLAALVVLAIGVSDAFAAARISRLGTTITLVSNGGADEIAFAGTSRSLVTFYAREGSLSAGPGCRRLPTRGSSRRIISCGAVARTPSAPLTLRARLGGGDDTLVVEPWDDRQPRLVADGGDGDDQIYGSTLRDRIDGGAGDDELYGLDDQDALDGGAGADVVVGGSGDDGVTGGPGVDRLYGDWQTPNPAWGIDTLTAFDFEADALQCGDGADSAAVDAIDATAGSGCENLTGGQTTPPPDTRGTLPLTVTIAELTPTPGGLARILRGQPIRFPVTFSAPSSIAATLEVSAAEARRLGLGGRRTVIARGLGPPMTITPVTLHAQMRLLWSARAALRDANRINATVTITGGGFGNAPATATRAITLTR